MRRPQWMRLTMEFDYEVWDGEERRLQVDVKYLPGRPAPACSNPDSPAFSDSGDPDELEIVRAVIVKDGKELPIPKEVLDEDRFIDSCLDEARKIVESMDQEGPDDDR